MIYLLLFKYYHCTKVKHLVFAKYNLCEYIEKIVVCMIITEVRRIEPDIWLEPTDHVENTKKYDENEMR